MWKLTFEIFDVEIIWLNISCSKCLAESVPGKVCFFKVNLGECAVEAI